MKHCVGESMLKDRLSEACFVQAFAKYRSQERVALLVCADDENDRVCLLFVLGRDADRRFAFCRCAPCGGVVCDNYLANLDWCFGLVLWFVFADAA